MMRVLTVRQPWAHAIAHLGKDVENRSWSTRYRGPVAILAGRTWAGETAQAVVEGISGAWLPKPLPAGTVVALVDLVDVHTPADCWVHGQGGCSPWAESGAYHWVLADVRPLAEPYGLLGSLGLRVASPDVEADILARVA